MGARSFPKLKIPHQSHADFCSTDTAGGLDNKKRRYAPRGGVAYRLFLWGFPKGATPPFGTRLCEAKCSVLYALPALPWKCRCRRGGQGHLKRQENRAVLAWRRAVSTGLVSTADWAYMKASVPRPMPNFGTKHPELVDTLPEKLKWAGSHFRAFPPWLPISKDEQDCQRRHIKCAVHLDRWLARLALLFSR